MADKELPLQGSLTLTKEEARITRAAIRSQLKAHDRQAKAQLEAGRRTVYEALKDEMVVMDNLLTRLV